MAVEGDGLGMVSLLLNLYNQNPPTGATSYHGPTNGVAAWDSVETDAEAVFGGTGPWVLSNWVITSETAPGAGTQYVFTLRVNEAATALTITLSGTNLTASDLTHSVTINPGQRVSIQCVPTGPPAALTRIRSVFKVTAAQTNQTPWVWASSTSHTEPAGATWYMYPLLGGLNSVESQAQVVCPTAGTVSALYANCQTAPGGVQTVTVTLRKNGVSTALTTTITGAAQTNSDLVNSVAVAAGDLLDWMVVTSGTAAVTRTRMGALFAPTVDGEMVYANTGALAQGSTSYSSGTAGFAATESQRQMAPQLAVTAKKLYLDCSISGLAAGQTAALTQRLAAAGTALTCSVTGTAATANDTTHSVGVLATDLIDWQVAIGAGAVTPVFFTWGAVLAIAQVPASGGAGGGRRALTGVGV